MRIVERQEDFEALSQWDKAFIIKLRPGRRTIYKRGRDWKNKRRTKQ